MPYLQDDSGRWIPAGKVDRCPLGAADERCQLRTHGRRGRKTGPRHPLVVLHCGVHGVFFSLYPPGFTPYARRLLAPVDESGEPLPLPDASPEADGEAWRGTFVEAALDAAQGVRWLRDDEPGPCSKPLYATQRRWLGRLERLFGLAGELAAVTVEAIRHRLGLPLTAHDRARRRAMGSRRLRERGRALVELAAVMTADSELWAELLGAGHLAKLWPEPWLWAPHRQQFSFPNGGARSGRRTRGP